MFKTLYGKLAIVLVVLLSLIAIFYVLLTLYSTRLYLQEVDQKFNRTLAANLLAGKDLLTAGRRGSRWLRWLRACARHALRLNYPGSDAPWGGRP